MPDSTAGDRALRAFLDHAPVGLLHVDATLSVVYENQRLREMTHRGTASSWIGRSVGEIEGLGSALQTAVEGIFDSGWPITAMRLTYRVSSGDERTFVVNGEAITDGSGAVNGIALSWSEGASERELEEELRFRRVFDLVEPILRNAALSLPSEHAFLDEVAKQLGNAAAADQVYVLLSAEDADAYEEEVRWAREPERSLVPLRMEGIGSELGDALAEGVAHLESRLGAPAGHGASILTALGAAEAIAVPFETSGARRGVLLLTRAATSAPWSAVERRMLRRLGALLETLLGWMRAEERYRFVISTVEDCLVAFGFDGSDRRSFSFATHQVEYQTGYSADDLMEGRISWLDDVVHPADRPAVLAFERRVRSGEECRLLYRVARPDGRIHWIRESLSPRPDSAGRLMVAGIISDVTDQKEAESALVQAKQDAETADRLKSAFLATMSHEMRTPLGVIRGFADLLLEELSTVDNVPPEVHEFVSTIQGNAAKVLQLVADLLDLSRLQTDRLPLESAPVAVASLLDDLVARYQSDLTERGITLVQKSHDEAIAIGDYGRIDQVLEIVMSNAAKFTEAGAITVSCEVTADLIVLSIVDTGIGIGEDAVDDVFEPFFQEDNRLNRDFEGTGLGLALAKRLMEAMGGSIRIESTKGEGTTVVLGLQRADA